MSEIEQVEIDQSVKPYLDEIAERLWSGHAALMVGSGLSKNAEPIRDSSSNFPNWAELGDALYEKLHGETPESVRYLNILKLAGEVQAAFGRAALDQLLRSRIPDKDYAPSELHVDLLSFPWTDVFTTNYDTLLERACSAVTSQKYDIVVNKEDLIHSEKPRIVKLHGTFPSHGHLIITEEDYRQYPKEFAPFVNTVQQALLENTLCLIGFSGDDPNFLQWIGWIRDNLGRDNSPKLYLVGVLSITDASKRLLEERNIAVVDLGTCSVGGSNFQGLQLFCKYLRSKKQEDNRLGWPPQEALTRPDPNDDNRTKQLVIVLPTWTATRQSFPGWCIVPGDRRGLLWAHTQDWIDTFCSASDLKPPTDINVAFELNWRLEKSLYPVLGDLSETLRKILDKYWPFSAPHLSDSTTINPSHPDYASLPWDDIRSKWLDLSLAMLRSYRHQGSHERWSKVNTSLNDLAKWLSSEQRARWHYERTLYALFSLDLEKVKSELNAWPFTETLPFWEVKRAGITAEIGKIEDAERILEQSLQKIRSNLNLVPITTDYSLVSQEAYTMRLLVDVKSAVYLAGGEFSRTTTFRRQYSDRWNVLKRYNCDPLGEMKHFETALDRTYAGRPSFRTTPQFDVGKFTKTHYLRGGDEEAALGFAFLLYCEDTGTPFRITNLILAATPAKGSLSRIAAYTPFWAMATMIRIANEDVVDEIFNRESLRSMDVAYVDDLITGYMRAITDCQEDIRKGHWFHADNFGIILARVIPEILSRMCCKCSDDARRALMSFLLSVYESDERDKYRGSGNLTRRLLDSLTLKRKAEVIPILLEFPVLGQLHPILSKEYPNPFQLLLQTKDEFDKQWLPELDERRIEEHFEFALSENEHHRQWSTCSLVALLTRGLLSDELTERVGEVLWEYRDKTGFPAHTIFRRWYFLELPHPQGVDPTAIFKDYILNTSIPIQAHLGKSGVGISHGSVPVIEDLVGAQRHVKWSNNEIGRLLDRLVEWWDADKRFVKAEESTVAWISIRDEFRKRFRNLTNACADVIIPALNLESAEGERKTVERLLAEFRDYGLFATRAEAAFAKGYPAEMLRTLERIEEALEADECEEISEGLGAVISIARDVQGGASEGLIELVGQLITWRRKVSFVAALQAAKALLDIGWVSRHEPFVERLLRGLEHIAVETNLETGSDDLTIFEKLEVRVAAARLAYAMFQFYAKKGGPIPAAISAWENICYSEDEFAEVRNQWLSLDRV